MWLWIALHLAQAGTLRVDAAVPAQVAVDGRLAAELWTEGRIEVEVPAGEHLVHVVRQGIGTDVSVVVVEDEVAVVVVGRTAVSTARASLPAAVVAGPREVAFRAVGEEPVLVQIGRRRVAVDPGQEQILTVEPGEHTLQVRNGAGTLVFAKGRLVLSGTDDGTGDHVVHVATGNAPEVAGEGLRYVPDGV